MAKFTFPTSGSTKWHISKELVYGIPAFAVFDIDWVKGSGTCRYGKKTLGTISMVTVNAARDRFTARFAIVHTHRDRRAASLTGTMSVSVRNDDGAISIRISGMADWRDNTTFEATRVKKPLPMHPYGGKHFEVILETSAAAKLVASAVFGNLHVKDTDREVEMTYPLVAVGVGLSVGVTALSITTFGNVKLPIARRYWHGATIEIQSAGTNVFVGSNYVKLIFTLPNKQTFVLETKGKEHLSLSCDVSVNWGTLQIGVLGPRTRESSY